MSADGKKKTYCPPIPADFSRKHTGPEWAPGESVSSARAKWGAYLRLCATLRPMPSQRHGMKQAA